MTEKKEDKEYKLSGFMFPENHNNSIFVINGGYNKKLESWETYLDLRYNNAYYPNEIMQSKKWKTKKEMQTSFKELYKVITDKINKIECDKTYESETTFMLSLLDKVRKENVSIKIPSVPVNILEKDGKLLMTVLATSDLDVSKDKYGYVYVDVTNDPTNMTAGATVSLGYYNYRFILKSAKVISMNPITLECDKNDFELKHLRPCRRLL